jgi:hypothetical protein
MKWLDKRRQKVKEYWDNLDLDRQLKIEEIKDHRNKRDCKTSIIEIIIICAIALFFLLSSVVAALTVHLFGGLDEYKKFRDGSYTIYPETVSMADYDSAVSTAYDDLDPNTIVNYNQLISNRLLYSNSTTDTRNYFNAVFTIAGSSRFSQSISSDGYYDKIINAVSTGSKQIVLKHSGAVSDLQIYIQNVDIITDHQYYFRFYVVSANPSVVGGLVVQDLIFIDLTTMFGDDVPTIEECRSIFISSYYSYSLGTPIYLNSFDSYSYGYTTGFNDAWDSQNVTYRQNVIGSSAFPYNFGTYTESQKIYDNASSAYMLAGIIGIPLGTVSNGTNISVDFTFLVPDWSGESLSFKQSFSLYFYYLDNSNLVNIGSIPYSNIDGNYGTYTGSFVVPITTDTVYMYFSTESYDFANGISPTQCLVFDSNMTFRTQDVSAAIQSAFGSGQTSVQQSYAPGSTLYNQIYRSGYNAGLEAENPYTFSALMSAVIEAPLNAVLGLFNFEFLGVNLKNVVTVLFTVAVLVAILGLFLGGK